MARAVPQRAGLQSRPNRAIGKRVFGRGSAGGYGQVRNGSLNADARAHRAIAWLTRRRCRSSSISTAR
ncbi:hypothetical protein ASD39_10595 [Sphingomonas sp. Root50]|nr:hypothetical protein ASD17_10535 [Sphingomonas sp. Root1294]KQY67541.1 hypothetical protein ASD39_10595 [Sphingomonas sp. Root50]KRB90918.1 hypothetical protein ASE22_11600 [Sphingomonas sp. Root720]